MSDHLIAVGIGNTSVKLGCTDHNTSAAPPAWTCRYELPTSGFSPEQLRRLLPDSPDSPARWLVASVQRAIEQQVCQWVKAARPNDKYFLLSHRDLPIAIDVEQPERVGMDRLATAVAANRLRQAAEAAVVVDAGTALTVNLVTADGVFRGGVILPGFKLTAKALAEGTDLLPLIVADLNADPPPVVGKSTEAAIRSGLFWGSVGAVRELVDRMSQDVHSPVRVFVTGGDAQRLAGYLAPDARFVPDLVLIGIASSSLAFDS
jgi:type III pantothenate kinase